MKTRLTLLFLSSSLFAEEVKPPSPFNFMGEFVNMLLTLALVLGLVFISLVFLKKLMRSKMRQLNYTTGIKILERRVLNTKSSLYLVDILGKGIVISESPAGIQLVTEFPPGTDIELLLTEEKMAGSEKITLKEGLQKKIASLFKKTSPTP